jgi:hypothetical protein
MVIDFHAHYPRQGNLIPRLIEALRDRLAV